MAGVGRHGQVWAGIAATGRHGQCSRYEQVQAHIAGMGRCGQVKQVWAGEAGTGRHKRYGQL